MKNTNLSLATVIIILLSPLLSLHAQYSWEPVPNVPDMLPALGKVVRTSQGRLWASGLYSSDDSGRSWKRLPGGSTLGVRDIAISPSEDLLVTGAAGLFRMASGDSLLRPWGVGLPDSATPSGILFMSDREVVLGVRFSDSSGTWRSHDGGATWSLVDTTFAADEIVHAADGTLLARRAYQLARSVDSGRTWLDVEGLPTGSNSYLVRDIAATPTSTICFAAIIGNDAEYRGIFRSTDAGRTWNRVLQTTYPNGSVQHAEAVTFSDDFSVIVAATRNGVYRSADTGTTWEPFLTVADHYPVAQTHELALAGGSLLVGTTFETLLVDLETGAFDPVREKLGPGSITSILPVTDDVILITIGHRLYRTVNGGGVWEEVDPHATAAMPIRVGHYNLEGMASDRIFLSGISVVENPGFLLVSEDSGATWQVNEPGEAGNLLSVTMLPDGSIIARNIDQPSVYSHMRSEDGGRSWHDINLTLNPRSAYGAKFAARDSLILVTTYDGTIHRTTDLGTTWSQVTALVNGDPGGDVRSDNPVSDFYLFADGTTIARRNDTLFRSEDSGLSWGRVEADDIGRSGLLFFFNDPGVIVYGRTTSGLKVSRDRGLTWEPMVNEGVPDSLALSGLSIAPTERLYMTLQYSAEIPSAGIYRTTRPLSVLENVWSIPALDLSINGVFPYSPPR